MMNRFDVYRNKFSNMHLMQLKHLKNQLEAREIAQKSVTTRKNWLEREQNAAYRNEYDRLRNEMERSVLPAETKQKLKNRVEYLRGLFSKGNV